MKLVTPEWYNARSGNKIHIEHGHAVDMFNAPDDSLDSIGAYPLGFFITRLVASAKDRKDQAVARDAVRGVLNTFRLKAERGGLEDERGLGTWLVAAIIDVLQVYSSVSDDARIRFSESKLDNQYTVGDVKDHYGDLLSTWHKKYPDTSDLFSSMLTAFLPNGLDWYAEKMLSSGTPPHILAMGHTHNSEKDGEYKNDGCWCNSVSFGHPHQTPTYVEIVGDVATLRYWKT